jgi:hypothetical protein
MTAEIPDSRFEVATFEAVGVGYLTAYPWAQTLTESIAWGDLERFLLKPSTWALPESSFANYG